MQLSPWFERQPVRPICLTQAGRAQSNPQRSLPEYEFLPERRRICRIVTPSFAPVPLAGRSLPTRSDGRPRCRRDKNTKRWPPARRRGDHDGGENSTPFAPWRRGIRCYGTASARGSRASASRATTGLIFPASMSHSNAPRVPRCRTVDVRIGLESARRRPHCAPAIGYVAVKIERQRDGWRARLRGDALEQRHRRSHCLRPPSRRAGRAGSRRNPRTPRHRSHRKSRDTRIASTGPPRIASRITE